MTDKTNTTSAKSSATDSTYYNILGAMSGLSQAQSGKTGAERAMGLGKIAAAIIAACA